MLLSPHCVHQNISYKRLTTYSSIKTHHFILIMYYYLKHQSHKNYFPNSKSQLDTHMGLLIPNMLLVKASHMINHFPTEIIQCILTWAFVHQQCTLTGVDRSSKRGSVQVSNVTNLCKTTWENGINLCQHATTSPQLWNGQQTSRISTSKSKMAASKTKMSASKSNMSVNRFHKAANGFTYHRGALEPLFFFLKIKFEIVKL